MAKRLQGKTALVFGAGSVGPGWGNGKACSVAYAREGAKVAAVDLNPAAAAETRGIIEAEGGTVIDIAADVTRIEDIRAAVQRCLDVFGRIDILHNNVGYSESGGAVDASLESWDRVMEVNLKSMLLSCRQVLPVMLEQGAGAIVNISSIAGIRWVGYPYISYSVSKAGVNQLTRSIALEYADQGIRANAILPGKLDTPHIYKHIAGHHASLEQMRRERAATVPMRRMGDAWDVAAAAVFLASDEAKFITGVLLPVDGGAHCVAP